MTQERPSPVLVLGVLLGVLLERLVYFGARSTLIMLAGAPPEHGGLAMEPREIGAFYSAFTSSAYLALLLGGVAAWLAGARLALVAGSATAALASFAIVALDPPSARFAAYALAVGHGVAAVSLYALAGRTMRTARGRFGLFLGAYLMNNVGALLAPWLASDLMEGIGMRAPYVAAGVLACAGVAIAAATFLARLEEGRAFDARGLGRGLAGAVLLTAAYVWFWGVNEVCARWAYEAKAPTVGVAEITIATVAASLLLLAYVAVRRRVSELHHVAAGLVLFAIWIGSRRYLLRPIDDDSLPAELLSLPFVTLAECLLVAGLSAAAAIVPGRLAAVALGFVMAAPAAVRWLPPIEPSSGALVVLGAGVPALAVALAVLSRWVPVARPEDDPPVAREDEPDDVWS